MKSRADAKVGRFKQRSASSRSAQDFLQHSALTASFASSSAAFTLDPSPPSLSDETSTATAATSHSSSSSSFPFPSLHSSSAHLRAVVEVSDAELSVALKRSMKRDPVTKVKALESLTVLFSCRTSQQLTAALPAFFHAFARLASDNDRRVREGLYPPLLTVMRECNKATTPWLKEIFPLWWSHCHDPDRDVSRAAWGTFTRTWVGEQRQGQLLHFVQREYLESLSWTLSSTMQSLSDMQVTSVEEAQERYDRIFSAALQGLATFMRRTRPTSTSEPTSAVPHTPTQRPSAAVPASGDTSASGSSGDGDSAAGAAAALSRYERLLDAAVRLLSSPRPLIRRSVYFLVTEAVHSVPLYFTERLPTLSSPVFDVIKEVEGANTAAMWDLLLTFLRAFPSALNHLPPEPLRFRALLRAIEKGGYGQPSLLYSHLLPLLSTLPSSSTSPAFFLSFFQALHESRLVGEQRGTGAVVSEGGNVTAMGLSFIECALYVVVSKRKEQGGHVSGVVLFDVLLPFIQRAMTGDEPFTHQLFRAAGKALSIVERQVRADSGKEGAEGGGGAVEGLSLLNLHFAVRELCLLTLERAEKEEGQEEGHRTPSRWTRVEWLLSALQDERAAQQQKRGETPSPSSSLESLGSQVFLHCLRAISRTPSPLPPLRLSLRLAQSFSLSSLLTAAAPPLRPSTLLSELLIPAFHRVVLRPPPSLLLSMSPAVMDSFFDLLAMTLRVDAEGQCQEEAGVDTAQNDGDQRRKTLNDLLSSTLAVTLSGGGGERETRGDVSGGGGALSGAAESTESVVGSVRGLELLQSFLSRLAPSQADLLSSHPLLDEAALTLTEALLTVSSSSFHSTFIALFASLLPLVSSSIFLAVTSSLVDCLSSFLSLSGRFAPTPVSPAEFRDVSGASVTCLPAILSICGQALLSPQQWSPPSSSASSSSSSSSSLLSSSVSSLFFLQAAVEPSIASTARTEWRRCFPPKSWEREDFASALPFIASAFHADLRASPIPSFTSAWILSWVEQSHRLLRSTTFAAALRSRVLDEVVGREGELRALMKREGEDDRVRVMRDCYCELMRGGGGKGTEEEGEEEVLVSPSELLAGRWWLLLDLRAIEGFLQWSSSTSASSTSSQAEGPLHRLTSNFVESLSADAFSALLERAVAVSSDSGGPYSDALRWLLLVRPPVTLQSTPSSSSSSPAVLFVRGVLLPLAQLDGSVALPSSFSSLLAPLTSSLPSTLTRSMQTTLTAFTECRATFYPVQSIHGGVDMREGFPSHVEVLMRALMAEVERSSAQALHQGRQQGGVHLQVGPLLRYLGSLLSSLSSIALHALLVPAPLLQRMEALLPLLPPTPSEYSTEGVEYLEGRARLLTALWKGVVRTGEGETLPTPPALNPSFASSPFSSSTLPLLVASACSSLSFALSLHPLEGSSPSTFAYLPPTFQFLHSALPWLSTPPPPALAQGRAAIAPSSALTEPLLSSLVHSAFAVLTSPTLLPLLTISRYETALSQLSAVVLHSFQRGKDSVRLSLLSALSSPSPRLLLSSLSALLSVVSPFPFPGPQLSLPPVLPSVPSRAI